jgi:hypothetical protein
MIICTQCGHSNLEGELVCANCGRLLGENVTETNLLGEDTGAIDPRRRWGTARFDTEDVLLLTVRNHESKPLSIRVNGDKTLGRLHRDSTPDIDLTPYEAYDQGVSRIHAVLRRQNDTITVTDLHSQNNTYLNGMRLVPDQPRIVRDGDEIRLGQLVMRVTFQNDPHPPG